MSESKLHFFCGKMAAGKSTMARALAAEENAILLSEDNWLRNLYPEEISQLSDYIKYSARIKSLLADHVCAILKSGVSVVMDFPGNTRKQRSWFRSIIDESKADHRLHFIDVSNEICLRQLKERSRDLPEGAPFTTEREFLAITEYFDPPSEEEAFSIIVHHREDG